jgi:hypothetical protein
LSGDGDGEPVRYHASILLAVGAARGGDLKVIALGGLIKQHLNYAISTCAKGVLGSSVCKAIDSGDVQKAIVTRAIDLV